MSKGYINKLLYEARLSMGIDRKAASYLLHISSLHLKLIEKGYLSVSKKRQQRFIEVYNLRSNFFENNSNYVIDIDKKVDEQLANAKAKKFIAKKALRWSALGLAVANAAWASYGIYCLNKSDWQPTAAWSGDFKNFWTNMKEVGTPTRSIVYPGDIKYTVQSTTPYVYDDGICQELISTLGMEKHALDTTLSAQYDFTVDSSRHPYLVKGSVLNFDVLVYNKKKIVVCNFRKPATASTPIFGIYDAMGVLDEKGNLTFRPFEYFDGRERKIAFENSQVFTEFSNQFNFYVARAYENFNKLFQQKNLVYKNVQDLIKDLNIISRDMVLHFRMGVWFTILGTVFGIGFAFILSLSFYFYYQFKKKGTYISNEYKPKVSKQVIFARYKPYLKDLKVKLVVPEFVLILIGLAILFLSQIAIYISITAFFKGSLIEFGETARLRNFSGNLLIAGVILLFYVKLDNYAKKPIKSLLINIFMFILLGLAFYLAEIILCSSFGTDDNLFGIIFKFLSGLLPGNFIWPLALYALLYLFLFTTPHKYRNSIKKINRFRLLSIIPSTLLVFNLIWQFAINQYVSNQFYYIKFLFFSKGAVITLFFLIYTFALFFYQRYCRLHLGFELTEQVFFNSKRYFIYKNSIAAVTLGALLIIDLIFRFVWPTNNISMGNNWAIGIIIPFVLFYHPHIGNRNAKWDIAVLILKALATFIGYIAAIAEVLTYLNFGDFFFILS